MTAQTATLTAHTSIAAATGVREHVIGLRESVAAKMDELVAFEDDLTTHRIALQILSARPEATGLELITDEEHNSIVRVASITGLDEDEDTLYQELVNIADEDLFVRSSLARRAAWSETWPRSPCWWKAAAPTTASPSTRGRSPPAERVLSEAHGSARISWPVLVLTGRAVQW